MRLKRRLDPGALTVNGRALRLDPTRLIGVGGEAEIFDIGGNYVLKRFKRPDHPDFTLSPEDQRGAAERLAVHQTKLPALMRLSLPPRVVAPAALALDGGRQIAGYTMPLVQNAEVLLRYTDRIFRQNGGIANATIVSILSDLHRTVAAVHQQGFVIGDFNDLNVLVSGTAAHLIDVDSFQFGTFVTPLFTMRFLDPRLTDGNVLSLRRAHDRDSDWYAFAVMAFQLFLFVDPYGGVYKPARPINRLPHDARPLRRITVFHPDVRYPKQAVPFTVLPDDLLHRFQQMFEHDTRGEFPLPLLESLRWTRCACRIEHARNVCPICASSAPRVARPLRVVYGRVTAEQIFSTTGVIVAATLADDRLLWLEHRQGRYMREDGNVVFEGPLDARVTFGLQQRATFATRGQEMVNDAHRYWIEGDSLLRDGHLGPERIGSILGGQTRFWVGPSFGFGFYRASEMTVAFVFDAQARGIRDSVPLPRIGGQIIDADAVFTNDRCWFFLATQERGRIRYRCTVIRRDGTVEATGDGDWLTRVRGNAAIGRFLLVATDDGIVRVEPDAGALTITATFPDTEGLVDPSTRLFAAAEGVYAVGHSEIKRLRVA